jgi:hypothetical protein
MKNLVVTLAESKGDDFANPDNSPNNVISKEAT